jgi:hypothetical protein
MTLAPKYTIAALALTLLSGAALAADNTDGVDFDNPASLQKTDITAIQTPEPATPQAEESVATAAPDQTDTDADNPDHGDGPMPVTVVTRGPHAFPNTKYTPGNLCTADDPNFKEYRYPEHVPYCNRNVTEAMKTQIANNYGGIPKSDWSNYEFDHLLPLGIGGDSSMDNIWPQPRGPEDSDGKDKLEDQLYKEMAAGTVTQKDAVQQIYDWFGKYLDKHSDVPQAYKDNFKKFMTTRPQ